MLNLVGGTEAADIPASVFAMPEGSIMRYDRPASVIADFVTGYHLYAARGPDAIGKVDWFLPGTANVRITLNAGPISVRIRRREFAPVPPVALFGPTSHALRAVTNGGIMIGFGVSALGWARLFQQPASSFHNVIAPLEHLTGTTLAGQLLDGLAAAEDEHTLKPVLDALLAPLLATPHPDEALIRDLMALMMDPQVIQVGDIADRLDIAAPRLRRVATRYFGMPIKPLLRRARFLRSFLGFFRTGDPAGYRGIDSSYHDASHFLRDANHYLGMTPRRFMTLSTPFLEASIRAREAVLGAATQVLHDVRTAPGKTQG